jgi:hypothetical protein
VDERADAMAWLNEGVPLTLLLDLLPSRGPDSLEIYAAEPADVGWVPNADVA